MGQYGLYRSPHKGFVQKVRSSVPIRHPQSGVEVDRIPSLRAEFGVFSPETTMVNPETGAFTAVADIRGGFFDTEAAGNRNGWSEDDMTLVDLVLRKVCRERPDYVQEIVPVHVPAPLPWATYGNADAQTAARLAVELGLVPEALRYERESLNRPDTIDALETAMLEVPEEEWGRAEEVEEIPASDLEEQAPHGVRIGKAPETTDTGIVKSTPGLVLNSGTITL